MGYGNQGIDIPPMPAYVKQQTGLTPIPQGNLKAKDVAPLILQMRKSEVKKERALQFALKEREYLRWLYKQKAGSAY